MFEAISDNQKKFVDVFLSKLKNGEYVETTNKCLCGHSDDLMLSDCDRYHIKIKTVICKNCGLVRSNPYYTNKTLEQFYKNEYRGIYSDSKICDKAFFDDQVLIGESLYQYLKLFFKSDIRNKKIIEIGCGAGGILEFFKKKGNKVNGCDYGEDYVNFGKKKGLNILVGGMEVFGNDRADVVILNHVLEHFTDPVGELLKVKKLLKQDGVVLVSVPGIYNIHRAYFDFQLFLQNAHAYYFTLKTLSYVFGLAGYKMETGNENIRAIFKQDKELVVKKIFLREKSSDIIRYLKNIRLYSFFYSLEKIVGVGVREINKCIKIKSLIRRLYEKKR